MSRFGLGAALLAGVLAGCASLPSVRPIPATPAPAPAPAPVVAAPDTTPSAEARDVLASIPEPLRPGERVPPPLPARSETAGTHFDATAADSGARDVPVPAPTAPLGERTLPPALPPDTAHAVPLTLPDSCFRVQLAAPLEKAKAERYREAAESQLLVPVVIETERGHHKVRTRDCLTRAAADALRRRAVDTGFAGAFRIGGATSSHPPGPAR